jgi:hypothetical protein
MSKWLTPDRYFVSFPCAVLPNYSISNKRGVIRSSVPTFVSYGGKTVADGLYLPFTFDAEEYKLYLTEVKQSCTGGSPSMPSSDRWSSKDFTLEQIFHPAKDLHSNIIEVKEYYPIDNWHRYVLYMRTEIAEKSYAPTRRYLTYKTYGKIKFEDLEDPINEE